MLLSLLKTTGTYLVSFKYALWVFAANKQASCDLLVQ